MGRVETRMYRRRQKRTRLRRLLLLLALAAVGMLLVLGRHTAFTAERIGAPTPTPVTAGFDQTVESREVTLAAESWYAIQTGVFSTQEAALLKADAYTERGAPGVVVKQGEKWRVFIACYGTEGEASAVRTRLEANQKVDTYLYEWTCPTLRLRLTGMAGQLDAAEAGFTLLNSTAAALRDMATQVDAGQFTVQEAFDAVQDMNSRIILWEETVRSRFGKDVPELVQGMLRITESWDNRYAALQASGDVTGLSAALKAQAMGMFDEICVWRAELAAQ